MKKQKKVVALYATTLTALLLFTGVITASADVVRNYRGDIENINMWKRIGIEISYRNNPGPVGSIPKTLNSPSVQPSGSIWTRNCNSTAERVAKAMGIVESNGRPIKGRSGEALSIWQWLPATWNKISSDYNKAVNGVKAPLTLCVVNEEKVVIWKCQHFLAKGYTPEEIGRIWNTSLGGREKPFKRKGVNKHGVRYDSIAHGQKVQAAYNSL